MRLREGEALAELVSGGDPDWAGVDRRRFLELVDMHRVAPWLFARRARTPLPDWLQPALAKRVAGMEALAMLDEFHRAEVLGALVNAGIGVIPLKGAVLGPWLYGRPALRPANDLDLLLFPEQLDKAASILKKLGYEAAERKRGRWSEKVSHEHAFWRGSDLPVELHVHVTQPGRFRIGLDELFARAEPWSWKGLALRRLDLEDQLLTLIVHAAHHQFLVPLVSWLDIRLLLDRGPDMATIAQRAGKWRMSGALYLAGRILAGLFGDGRLADAAPKMGAVRRLALLPWASARVARADTRGVLADRWGAFWLIDSPAARVRFTASYLVRQSLDGLERRGRVPSGWVAKAAAGFSETAAGEIRDRTSFSPRKGDAR